MLIAPRSSNRAAGWARNICNSRLLKDAPVQVGVLVSCPVRQNILLKSDGMITPGNLRACCLVADKFRVRAVLDISLPIGGNQTEVEVPQMPPTFQHDPPFEWLASGSHNNAIVLAPGIRIVFAPVQFEALKPQRIKGDEEVLRPLVTVTTFSQAVINEEVIENRRAKHAVFPPKLAYGRERAVCQQRCFVPIHF